MVLDKYIYNKNFLVTGGAGFIGSNIVGTLLNYNGNVIVFDNFFTGDRDGLEFVVQDYTHNYQILIDKKQLVIVRGSVELENLDSYVEWADYVIHLAARNIIASTKDPEADCHSNILGTIRVLEACKKYKKRVVYSSSASVYGNPLIIPTPEESLVHTFSPYAVSKLAGENYCKAYYETWGLETSVVRYSNIYGFGQIPTNPYVGVISRIFEALYGGKEFFIHGDGLSTRDYTYIVDAVEGTLYTLFSPKSVGESFNLGTGVGISVKELVKESIEAALEIWGERAHILKIQYVDRRDIDNVRHRVMNIEKIRTRLGWVPTITLSQGLRKTAKYIANYNKFIKNIEKK